MGRGIIYHTVQENNGNGGDKKKFWKNNLKMVLEKVCLSWERGLFR